MSPANAAATVDVNPGHRKSSAPSVLGGAAHASPPGRVTTKVSLREPIIPLDFAVSGKGDGVTAVLSLLAAACAVVLALRGASFAWAVAQQASPVLPFESGMQPQQHAVSRYHARWYAVTILFLAFDMEMIFMYPWAVVVADMGAAGVAEMFGFLGVLLVGVVYVWREGALRWT